MSKRYFQLPCVWMCVVFFVGLGHPYQALANASLDKAIQMFKDFDIRGAKKLLHEVESAGGLGSSELSRTQLYLGMSYAYLRNKPEAEKYFRKALKTDPNLVLPKGTPARLRKMFVAVRSELGGSAPVVRSSTPAVVRRDPPPVREDPPPARIEPPVRREEPRTAPPARREMTFGTFSIRRTAPRPVERRVVDPFQEPAVRREEPVVRREEPPVRVALKRGADPDLIREENKKKVKMTGGVPLVVTGIVAGLGVAAVGGGVGLGVLASDKASAGEKVDVPQVQIPAIEKEAQGFATGANVLFVGGGVMVAAAVVLFFLRPKKIAAKKNTAALSDALPVAGSPLGPAARVTP